jgi:hypothetical protein
MAVRTNVAGVTTITNIDILTSVLRIRKKRLMMMDIDRQHVALKQKKKRPKCVFVEHNVLSVYAYKYPTRCNSGILFYCKITLHVSGTLRAHHQENNNCS